MRYAIVSDLHANIRAWNSVLADLRAQGADVVVCLGDVVGYGPNPAEVLKGVRAVTTNFVLGNHDAAAVGMIDYSIFNEHARNAIEWTMTALDPEAKNFLSSVPLTIDTGEILFVHAEISEPGRFDYITDKLIAKENFRVRDHLVTFIGHTHHPKIFELHQNGIVGEFPDKDIRLQQGKRYIVNVGSVGEPRDSDDLRARYVIYDSATRDVIFRRVEFDIPAYRKDLEATSLTFRPFFLQVYEHIEEGREVVVTSKGIPLDMKVSHNSASLVDLGKVSSVANISNSGMLLKSAQPSRAPLIIFAIAAILTLVTVGFLFLSDNKNSSPTPTLAKRESETKPDPKPEPPKNSPPTEEKTSKSKPKPEPTPEIITKIPDNPKPKPKPKPETNVGSIPKPPEPKPTPVPDASNDTVEVAWWRMGDGKDEDALVDEKGQVTLIPIKSGKTIKALAPDPVPANQETNSEAKQLGVWQEEKSNNHFALTTKHSFTFEGWFRISKFQKIVYLFGTRSNKEDRRGWHLDLRPIENSQLGESICFFHDSGKIRTEAKANKLKLTDGKPHHFAIVWDHDFKPDQGQMKVYLDGNEVATAPLPHDQVNDEQFHPFSVGAEINRANLGLDELRFTRKTLQPHEFLLRADIKGATFVKSGKDNSESWSIPENWKDGKVPSGDQSVIIDPGNRAEIVKISPPSFTGSLVLKEKAVLQIWIKDGEHVIPKSDGKLVMYQDSKLILRTPDNTNLGPIELIELASVFGGNSTNGHRTTRIFSSKITGPGKLILQGVTGNTFIFQKENSFTGGLSIISSQKQTFKVVAAANGSLGKGAVVLRDHASLQINKDLENTISDGSGLLLYGPKGTLSTKLVLDSDETVGRFVIDDVDQGKGVFTKVTHPKIISGEGKLTVE